MFIAEIIKSRKPYPKMSFNDILTEANRRQHLDPKIAHRRPLSDWKVNLWTDLKGNKTAQTWISKIRAVPRYLPYDYLSELGKKRFKMGREYRNE
jgi:hypothetical protein